MATKEKKSTGITVEELGVSELGVGQLTVRERVGIRKRMGW
jgi:hypothetical protein